jgi:hypothetical protein
MDAHDRLLAFWLFLFLTGAGVALVIYVIKRRRRK